MLPIIHKCLARQSFKDFEWNIVGPKKVVQSAGEQFSEHFGEGFTYIIEEPLKYNNDYYSLNKAWNAAFHESKGELIISIQDGLWFPSDMLEKFWEHYQSNPKSIISAVGNQYDQLENGKPEHCCWTDPRKRTDFESFYEVEPSEIEFCIASIPTQALFDVGGIDEEFDKYAAIAEKEMTYRMQKAGYTCYLDQGIEYRAIHHPRLSEEWEERYQAGCKYYVECLKEIRLGNRCKLAYLLE